MFTLLPQPTSDTQRSMLPLDCLDSIFKWLQPDCASLSACCRTNKRWCERGLRILYSRPFDFLHSLNAPNSPEELYIEQQSTVDISTRLQSFLSTLIRDDSRRQHKGKVGYIDYLGQLDFLLINSILGESFSVLESYSQDEIQCTLNMLKYWRNLESLSCNENVFYKQLLTLDPRVQYGRLHHLDIHFDKNQGPALSSQNLHHIAQCCRNLRVLRIRARHSFTDGDLAILIQQQQPNSLRELTIEQSQEISFEKSLSALYTQHKNSFVKTRFLWCNQLSTLNELGAFPRLESLEISNCHRFTNVGLSSPNGSFKSLKHLVLRETAISSSKVACICKNSGAALQTLNVSVDRQLRTDLVKALVNHCPGLKNLAFSCLPFALSDLELLSSGCVHLQKLKLGHPQENDLRLIETALCNAIGAWSELEYLDVGHTPITPLVIGRLSTRQSLRQLRIDFAFQSNVFWTQVAMALGERFIWNVHRNDLDVVVYQL